jgi:trehalose/maltose hydrolase-like predicted phosphorylase
MADHQAPEELSGPAWVISYHDYELGEEGRREAIFAQGNGVFVTRAASTEARPDGHHYPGTYRAVCYENLCSEVAGETDELESLANLPNWLWLRFRIEDGPWLNLDEVSLSDYRHSLDLKRGLARRCWSFTDREGRCTRVSETRLVSMAERERAILRLKITPLNWSGTLAIDSGIDGRIENTNVARYSAYETRHIEVVECAHLWESALRLTARTRRSGIRIVEAVTHTFDTRPQREERRSSPGEITCRYLFDVHEGEHLILEKTAALCTSLDAQDPESAAVESLRAVPSFADILERHAAAWADIWRRADIRAENDETVSLGLRFHVFHLLQTVSPLSAALDTGVPARGWHGEGYRGHIFWDDMFVFPFLNFHYPALARALLMYRYRRLDAAREAARESGHRGAMFPWRSAASGREVTPRYQYNLLSGHWMSDPTRMQCHINAAIVYNIWHYYLATGDRDFLHRYGAEIILEIARYWSSIAEYNPQLDRFEIKYVIGPDEYHNSYPDRDTPGLDNNAYTNIMAVWSLCRGLEVLDHLAPDRRDELASRLQLDEQELQRWDEISRKMRIVFHGDGVISQFEGFEKLKPFSRELLPESLREKRVDWALEAIGESADDYQVIKQADTLTLLYLFPSCELFPLFERLGYSLDQEQLLRTADYYLARSTHRSSLSRIVYAGALAQLDPEHSWEFFRKSLETDLRTLKGETVAEGIHLGAMGGTLDIVQRRYLGLDVDAEGRLHVDPAMPTALGRICMPLLFRGNHLEITGSAKGITLRSSADNNERIQLLNKGRETFLAPGEECFLQA